MEEQLVSWHFDCPEDTPSVDEPAVSLGLTVSKAKVLRGLEHLWGKEYMAWTCSTRGKLEFPPRPWQCECQQRFFADGAPTEERQFVFQLRNRDAIIPAFEVLMGRPFAAAVLAMVTRQQTGT